jgi:hypothetical protein
VGFAIASAERRMPRREGEVFRLGTAIVVSSWDVLSGIAAKRGRRRRRMPVKAGLIEDGVWYC